MLNNQFIILVADTDPVVGAVSARLLSSALEAQTAIFSPIVRVLVSQEELDFVYEPKLPPEVQAISQPVVAATTTEIECANLIVGFSGVDEMKVKKLRNAGISAPAVGLCQFVLNLNELTKSYVNQKSDDVHNVLVGSALQFGFAGGSTECAICADKVGDSLDYWINIADTCSRFAQFMQQLQA